MFSATVPEKSVCNHIPSVFEIEVKTRYLSAVELVFKHKVFGNYPSF